MVWERFYLKKEKEKKKEKRGKTRKLHKIEHGVGYGFDSWAFSAFFPFVENNSFFKNFFFF